MTIWEFYGGQYSGNPCEEYIKILSQTLHVSKTMFIFEIHTFEQLTPKQPIMACRGVPSGDFSEIHVYMCVCVYLATPLKRQWIWMRISWGNMGPISSASPSAYIIKSLPIWHLCTRMSWINAEIPVFLQNFFSTCSTPQASL